MKRTMRLAAALAVVVLVGAIRARAGEYTPIIVTVGGFTGLPQDSASRATFLDAFHHEFDADTLGCQKRAGEQWSSSGERLNHFRLVDLAAPEAAWALDLTIGLPPSVVLAQPKAKKSDPTPRPRSTDYRASRGLTIVAAATAPVGTSRGMPAEPIKFAVYFPDAKRVVVPSYKLPGGAYAYPWVDAGRVVARAALEVLHRANAMMAVDERADLSPAVRTEDTP